MRFENGIRVNVGSINYMGRDGAHLYLGGINDFRGLGSLNRSGFYVGVNSSITVQNATFNYISNVNSMRLFTGGLTLSFINSSATFADGTGYGGLYFSGAAGAAASRLIFDGYAGFINNISANPGAGLGSPLGNLSASFTGPRFEFIGNASAQDGGGLAVYDGGDFVFGGSSVIFRDNASNQNYLGGGAVSMRNAKLEFNNLQYIEFIGNTAASSGGAVFMEGGELVFNALSRNMNINWTNNNMWGGRANDIFMFSYSGLEGNVIFNAQGANINLTNSLRKNGSGGSIIKSGEKALIVNGDIFEARGGSFIVEAGSVVFNVAIASFGHFLADGSNPKDLIFKGFQSNVISFSSAYADNLRLGDGKLFMGFQFDNLSLNGYGDIIYAAGNLEFLNNVVLMALTFDGNTNSTAPFLKIMGDMAGIDPLQIISPNPYAYSILYEASQKTFYIRLGASSPWDVFVTSYQTVENGGIVNLGQDIEATPFSLEFSSTNATVFTINGNGFIVDSKGRLNKTMWINASGSSITIRDITFQNFYLNNRLPARPTVANHGGIIALRDNSKVHFVGTISFINSSATQSGALGGAIYVNNSSIVFLPNSSVTFFANRAQSNGGAIYLNNSDLYFDALRGDIKAFFAENMAGTNLNDIHLNMGVNGRGITFNASGGRMIEFTNGLRVTASGAGNYALSKIGAGTLKFSGADVILPKLDINAGTVVFHSNKTTMTSMSAESSIINMQNGLFGNIYVTGTAGNTTINGIELFMDFEFKIGADYIRIFNSLQLNGGIALNPAFLNGAVGSSNERLAFMQAANDVLSPERVYLNEIAAETYDIEYYDKTFYLVYRSTLPWDVFVRKYKRLENNRTVSLVEDIDAYHSWALVIASNTAQDFTIDGAGFSADSAGKYNMGFLFEDKNLTISSITLMNFIRAQTPRTPINAVYARDGSYIRLNVFITFINNISSYGAGGAMFAENSTLELVGTSISFINNATVYNGTDGGALSLSHSTAIFRNARAYFIGNIVSGDLPADGGALDIGLSKLNFENSSAVFIANKAAQGGAVKIGGGARLNFINSTASFISNSVDSNGGAVFLNGNLNISANSRFIFFNNRSEGDGGGIYGSNTSLISIADSRVYFTSNSASGEKNDGGALYLEGVNARIHSISNSNVVFTSNSATKRGGAVYVGGANLEIVSSTALFHWNKVYGDAVIDRHGGALFANGGSAISFINTYSEFIGNKISPNGNEDIWGGALAIGDSGTGNDGGKLSFIGGSAYFKGNITSDSVNNSGYGGALSLSKGNIGLFSGMRTIEFSSNIAHKGGGGAIIVLTAASLVFRDNDNVYFYGNEVIGTQAQPYSGGGAIIIKSGGSNVSFINNANVIFKGNRTGGSFKGGAVILETTGTRLSLINAVGQSILFENNWMGDIPNDVYTIVKSTLFMNIGGEVKMMDGIEFSTGLIFKKGRGTWYLSGRNEIYGLSIPLEVEGRMIVENATFTWRMTNASNFRPISDGVVGPEISFINSSVTIMGSIGTTYAENVRPPAAIGIYGKAGGSLLSFINSKTWLINNRSNWDGGAISVFNDGWSEYSASNRILFSGGLVVFSSNSTTSGGGGVSARNSLTSMKFENNLSSWTKNTVVKYGGAILIFDKAQVSFEASTAYFVDNKVTETNTSHYDYGGGAIWVSRFGSKLSFENSNVVFYNNEAGTHGGVLWVGDYVNEVIGSTVVFIRSKAAFSSNKAASAASWGGAIYIKANSFLGIFSSSLTFENNTAATGGAIAANVGSVIIVSESALTFTNNGNAAGTIKNDIYMTGSAALPSALLIDKSTVSMPGGIIAVNNSSISIRESRLYVENLNTFTNLPSFSLISSSFTAFKATTVWTNSQTPLFIRSTITWSASSISFVNNAGLGFYAFGSNILVKNSILRTHSGVKVDGGKINIDGSGGRESIWNINGNVSFKGMAQVLLIKSTMTVAGGIFDYLDSAVLSLKGSNLRFTGAWSSITFSGILGDYDVDLGLSADNIPSELTFNSVGSNGIAWLTNGLRINGVARSSINKEGTGLMAFRENSFLMTVPFNVSGGTIAFYGVKSTVSVLNIKSN
jgi:predicted outer membrane repeat protein